MPLLTLSEDSWRRVVRRGKVTTVRANTAWWERHWARGHRTLHVWSPSPRSGRGVKRGVVPWLDYEVVRGGLLHGEDARRDGYDSAEELVAALAAYNRISVPEVRERAWIIIEFPPYEAWGGEGRGHDEG